MNLFRDKPSTKRLHRFGEYSYTVIVPKKWLLQNGMPSEVKVQAKRGKIIITPVKGQLDKIKKV